MMTDRKRHPHADMIHEWAENPERVVEVYRSGRWHLITDYPTWSPFRSYRFADTPDKVSPPPQVRTYQQRVEIPAALEELPEDDVVYAPDLYCWGQNVDYAPFGSVMADRWLRLGIAYATREEALARRDAMLRTEKEEG